MLDWWFDHVNNYTVYVLTPAIVGRDGKQSPAIPTGACTFLNGHGLCGLHNLELKPTEGRESLCKGRTEKDLHERVAETWNNPAAQQLVEAWEIAGTYGRRTKPQ